MRRTFDVVWQERLAALREINIKFIRQGSEIQAKSRLASIELPLLCPSRIPTSRSLSPRLRRPPRTRHQRDRLSRGHFTVGLVSACALDCSTFDVM